MSTEVDERHVDLEDRPVSDEPEREGMRSIFSPLWFRVLIALTALSAAGAVALPYLLDWLEPRSASVQKTATVHPRAMARIASPPRSSTARITPAPRPVEALKPAVATARSTATLPAGPVGNAVASAAPSRSPEGPAGYWVQLGLFRDLSNAERLASSVRHQGFSVQVVTRNSPDTTVDGTYHLVRAGAFRDQVQAAAARNDLMARGYSGFLTEGTVR